MRWVLASIASFLIFSLTLVSYLRLLVKPVSNRESLPRFGRTQNKPACTETSSKDGRLTP